MANLKDVVDASVAQIVTGMVGTTIAGRTFGYAPDSINPPTAIVLPSQGSPVTFGVTMDGKDAFNLTIKLLMGAADERSGQVELMGYLARSGAASVFAAFAADPTLGGVVSYAIVTQVSNYGDVEWAGQIFFGADLDVEAYS
jgi:hypothetical protein